ncbi:MAG: saccharopine dehydrogenase C-terminal domain-containing protein [Flavobacteriales bacterium]|nr:saccharopine dehydrogenase C-terminal domain-containing protein [Flavobacteriales bacterium]
MKKVVVLGAGLVGSAIAIDLKKSFDVTSVDINEEALKKLETHEIKTTVANLSDYTATQKLVGDFDLVVGAVPGFMGYKTVEAVIHAGKNMVDISFFPEDPFGLDNLAKEKGVTVVTDCGVAPGMGNIILGYHNTQMQVTRYECLVGGLPVVREWPWEYKAVFSPIDVIEEYVRPARYVQNGSVVVREALSDAELVEFPVIGTLESWNSDGLRSLIRTMPHIPDMIEKTLRYPGCIEYLRVLRAGGFFSYDEIEVNGQKIRPIDVTSKLLFPKWKLKPGEEDFTIMRIVIEGMPHPANSGQSREEKEKITYHLLDRFDKNSSTISMARTTGYTCTAVSHLVLDEKFSRKGICPPEYVGDEKGCFEFVSEYLKERGVKYEMNQTFS